MTPVAATKLNEVSQRLWDALLRGKPLSELEIFACQKDIKALRRIQPDGAALLSAMLAVLIDDQTNVKPMAEQALPVCSDEVSLYNWKAFLTNLGHIRLAFSFAKKYTDLYPDDITAWNSLIDLAHALKDAPILEKALDNWHRLNPAKQHSLVITDILDQMLIDATDEDVTVFLDSVFSPPHPDTTTEFKGLHIERTLLTGI